MPLPFAIREHSTFVPPAGLADGDLLAICLLEYQIFGGFVPITPPPGFAVLNGAPAGPLITVDPSDGGEGEMYGFVWWKRASAESGSYVCLHDTTRSAGVLLRVTGGKATGDPTADFPFTTNKGLNSNPARAFGGTTTTPGNLIVFFTGMWEPSTPGGPPAGVNPVFTQRHSEFGYAVYVATGTQATAGPTNDRTVVGAGTNGWLATQFSLQSSNTAPAPGGSVTDDGSIQLGHRSSFDGVVSIGGSW